MLTNNEIKSLDKNKINKLYTKEVNQLQTQLYKNFIESEKFKKSKSRKVETLCRRSQKQKVKNNKKKNKLLCKQTTKIKTKR